MNQIRRRVNAAVNPVSTAATRWWCHSALRHMLTGYGPTARQRHLIRHETQASRFEPSAEQGAAGPATTRGPIQLPLDGILEALECRGLGKADQVDADDFREQARVARSRRLVSG
jgi:hypothetical protein